MVLSVFFKSLTRRSRNNRSSWIFYVKPTIIWWRGHVQGIMAVLVQFFFAWRLGILTKSWSLVAVICFGSISGGSESTFFIREQTYITIHFSAGAIATSFEVGRTPQFVDFRNFKASPKFSSVVPYWWSSLVSRDHLACFFSHHGPHHNNLLSLVFVSSFSVSFNLAYWCFSSLGWVSMRLGIICQFHDAG